LRRLASLLLPPLAVMGLIFLGSAQTSDEQDRALWELLLRKLGHVTEYFVLTLLAWRALRELGVRWSQQAQVAGAALFSLAYAASDEFHQTFVQGRVGTPRDVLIDSIGIVLACWVATRIYARRRRTVGPSRPSAA
jgi:VanZ family protein